MERVHFPALFDSPPAPLSVATKREMPGTSAFVGTDSPSIVYERGGAAQAAGVSEKSVSVLSFYPFDANMLNV